MPKPLFVQPPTISAAEFLPPHEALKTAGIRLVTPPGAWSDEVLQTLLRDNPYMPYDRLVVTFKQRDDAMGCAVGYIGIIDAPKVSIPVIIVNRELKPLDIMVVRSPDQAGEATMDEGSSNASDQIMPLTQLNFEQACDDASIGTVVDPSQRMATGFTEDGSAMRLPMRGRTVLAHVLGASAEKRAEFTELLKNDKSIYAGMYMHGHGEIVNAWLNAPAPTAKLAAKLAGLPVTVSYGRMLEALPEVKNLEDFDSGTVFLADGSSKLAVALKTVSLHAPQLGPQEILAFEDGTYCKAASAVVCIPAPEAASQIVTKLSAASLRVGADIMFVTDDALTAPAKIASIAIDDASGTYHVMLTDAMGASTRVCLSRGIKVASYDPTDSVWLMPVGTKLLRLGNYATDMESPISETKAAQVLKSLVPDQLMVSNGQWALRTLSPEIGFSQVSKTAAVEYLNKWFANGDELVKVAEAKGVVRFDGNIQATVNDVARQTKVASGLSEAAAKAITEVALPLAAAAKLAATIGRTDCADAILGTGFLNQDNLAEFLDLQGTFEQTVSGLARLLLAIRMGMPGDENATAVAMKALQRVTERLRSANQEVNTSAY